MELENAPFLPPLELLHAAVPPPGTAPTATVLEANEIAVPVVGVCVVRLLSWFWPFVEDVAAVADVVAFGACEFVDVPPTLSTSAVDVESVFATVSFGGAHSFQRCLAASSFTISRV